MKLEIPQLHGNGSHAGALVSERPVLALKANSAASAGPVQLSGGPGGRLFHHRVLQISSRCPNEEASPRLNSEPLGWFAPRLCSADSLLR